jgi:hypothetical protein
VRRHPLNFAPTFPWRTAEVGEMGIRARSRKAARVTALGRFEPFAGDARLTGLVESRYEQRRSSPSVRLGNRFAPAA